MVTKAHELIRGEQVSGWGEVYRSGLQARMQSMGYGARPARSPPRDAMRCLNITEMELPMELPPKNMRKKKDASLQSAHHETQLASEPIPQKQERGC